MLAQACPKAEEAATAEENEPHGRAEWILDAARYRDGGLRNPK